MKKILLIVLFLFWASLAFSQSTIVTFAWDAPSPATGLTGYQMYRGTSATCADCTKIGAILTPTTLTYADTTPVSPNIYYYAVTAIYGTVESGKSNIVKLDLSVIPAKPANLRSTTVIFP